MRQYVFALPVATGREVRDSTSTPLSPSPFIHPLTILPYEGKGA